MLRVALIGAGDHCRRYHAPALARYAAENPGQAELAAVCDLERERAETLATEYGFAAVHTDVDAMIEAEKPGAIVCVVPVAKTLPP